VLNKNYDLAEKYYKLVADNKNSQLTGAQAILGYFYQIMYIIIN